MVLLLCPSTLSYDWQMGSIPLLQKLTDIRNLASLSLFVSLLLITRYCLQKNKVKLKHDKYGNNALHVARHIIEIREIQIRECKKPSWHVLFSLQKTISPSRLPATLGLLLLVLPFLPAANIVCPVGFVLAERVLYIPRWLLATQIILVIMKIHHVFATLKFTSSLQHGFNPPSHSHFWSVLGSNA